MRLIDHALAVLYGAIPLILLIIAAVAIHAFFAYAGPRVVIAATVLVCLVAAWLIGQDLA